MAHLTYTQKLRDALEFLLKNFDSKKNSAEAIIRANKLLKETEVHVFTLTMEISVDDLKRFEQLLNEKVASGEIHSYQAVAGGEVDVKYDVNFTSIRAVADTFYRWGRLK